MLFYAKLVLMAVFLGGAFVAGRYISPQVSPFAGAFMRFFIASSFLVAYSFRWRGELTGLGSGQYLALLAAGMIGIMGFNLCFFWGLSLIPASRAALIFAINPGLCAIFSALVLRERLGPAKAVGIGLAILGAMVVISKGSPWAVFDSGFGWGEAAIMGAATCWATYAVIGKGALPAIKPLLATTAACVIGTVGLAFPAFGNGLLSELPTYTWSTWLALFYLGFLGAALPYTWFYQGVQTIGPSRTGAFMSLVPISGVTASIILLGEPMGLPLLAGVVLVTVGLYLTNLPPGTLNIFKKV